MGVRQRGFTLLELLISLALMGLLLVVLYGGLRLGSDSWERLEAHVQTTGDLRLVRAWVAQALRQTQKVHLRIRNRRRLLFHGEAGEMDFVAPLARYAGVGGLYLVRLFAVQGEDGWELWMQRWLAHPEVLRGETEVPGWNPDEAPPGAPMEEEGPEGIYGLKRLLGGLEEPRFRYLADAGRTTAAWKEEWRDPNRLPDLVELTLQRPDTPLPPLVVALPRR